MLARAMSGLPGMPGGSVGFSRNDDDPVVLVDMHDAEAGGLHARHLEAADGDVGAGSTCCCSIRLVVHLVDVVAGQDDHELGPVGLDDVDVLVDRVGGALVPLVSETRWLAGRMSKLSLRSGRKKFQPRCRWRIRLCALYWVATPMRRMPELSALDSAKSMIRALPPK